MAGRARRYERSFRERHGVTAAAETLTDGDTARVRHGLFEGMAYPTARLAEVDAPVAKLLGTYEHEIHYAFANALARGLVTFIDIGSAYGYFAMGLPYREPDLVSYAFDIARSARNLCSDVSRLNAVAARVRIAGRFTKASLDAVDPAGALLLCDIEGAERWLFGPDLVARLNETSVIIEVHEHSDLGLSEALRRKFETTHTVTTVSQQTRHAAYGFPATAFKEFRPPELHWLVCEPLRT
jgi:hypothetical protein